MRKIEEKMLKAIEQWTNWQQDNTAVQRMGDNVLDVYLHGHQIATVVKDKTGEVTRYLNPMTLYHWPTNTTKSRLRALGFDVYTNRGVTYHGDIAISNA